VDFPNDPSECHGEDPQNPRQVKAEIDHRSPLIGGLRQHLLAAIYFFGAQAGVCKAPIIVGNG
jgi:hypothetical protein